MRSKVIIRSEPVNIYPLFNNTNKKKENLKIKDEISINSRIIINEYSICSFSFLNLSKKKLIDFYFISKLECIKELDLSNNLFENFKGLGFNNNIEKLNLSNCPINSFKGAITLPNLISINFTNCPISNNPLLIPLSLIAFGGNLKYINFTTISNNDRKIAKDFGIKGQLFIRKGWIPNSLNPKLEIEENFEILNFNNKNNLKKINLSTYFENKTLKQEKLIKELNKIKKI